MWMTVAAVVLTAASTIEADLQGGEVHAYDVDLRAGTFFAITIDQRGADVRPVILAPNGTVIVDIDAGDWGDETASIVADIGGRYHVEARAAEAVAAAGHYTLRVDALRPATDRDRRWAAAVLIQSRAYLTLKRGGRDNMIKAHDLYQQTLDAWQAIGNRRGEADAFMALGYVANWLDDFRGSADYNLKDLEIRRAIGDDYGEARALGWHAGRARLLGEVNDAIGLLEEALARHRAAGRLARSVDVLAQISLTARLVGDYGLALERGYEAVAISRTIGEPAREAQALAAIGAAHLDLGELEQAVAVYRRITQLAPNNPTFDGLVPGQIGLAMARLGRYTEAEQALQQSLAIFAGRGWRANESNTLRYFGELYMRQDEFARAGDAFERAADKARESGYVFGEAVSRRQAAEALLRLGKLDAADAALTKAAEVFNNRDPIALAIVWTDQARLALRRADLSTARARAEAALEVVESLRGRAASARIRGAMLASTHTVYSTLIDVLMAEHALHPADGFDRSAFDVAERARARSLLEQLLDDRLGDKSADERAPLAGLRAAHRRVSAKARALDDARRTRNTELIASLSRELDELTSEYGILEGRLRREEPSAAIVNPQPVSLAGVQRDVLDDGTVLVEFSLGDEASYAWVVSRATVAVARLASKATIEAAVQDLQQTIRARRPADDALTTLSALLVRPLHTLPSRGRVVIVATGPLQQVPFAALRAGASAEPMVARFELVHAPSVSVIAALRSAAATGARPSRIAAVFADPVFGADDPRAKAGPSTETALATVPGRPESQIRDGLSRLPFTRLEADAIAALVPPSSLRIATGFDATVGAAMRPDLGNYRIVHFATHGLIDTRTPELSGLALSMVDKDGHPQDGFLRLFDVGRLHLNADLVVLSGCETALGRTLEGEGVIGLTRGFFAAGASRVVASLWKVDDLATAELMKVFYREMLHNHRPAAAALAAAQRRLSADRRWSHPFFWAGFVIQGEWR